MRTAKQLLITVAVLLCSTVASAHDIEVGGFYYNIISSSDLTVRVTYKGFSYNSYYEYSGAVVIPATVIYNSKTYSVTAIGDDAFRECTGLTSITIPNSVTTIGNYAFYKCTGLTSVTIGNGVTSIGDCAFLSCDGLTSVTIPNSVTTIGDWAFEDCDGLTNVTIPNSVITIGDWAFNGCDGLTSIEIPNSVTTIGDDAFSCCDGLTSITIGNSVTTIEYMAFSGCDGLTSITIGNSVTTIGDWAFYNCTGLTSITIPNSVTSIGDYAFYKCTGLTSVTIPNSVTTIGLGAFSGCDGLKTVYNFSSLILTAGSSANGYVAYYADKVINAPNGSIEGDYVFDIIDGVNTLCGYIGNGGDIVLPADCKGKNYVIGANAFKDEKAITSVTIPNSVTNIGRAAFSGCTNLKEIYSLSETPPVFIDSSTFSDYSATLYVPIGAKETYQTTYYWKEFANIVEMDFTGIDKIKADATDGFGNGVIYDLNGRPVNEPAKGGIYIIGGKKVVW